MNKLVALVAIVLLTIVSCSKDDNIIVPVAFETKVTFDGNFNNKEVEGVEVFLTSTTSNNSYTAKTGADGIVKFEAVNPGIYNIAATLTFTNDQYEVFFGLPTDQADVNFSGALENVTINDSSLNDDVVVLKTSKIGDLVIKQIYYTGSDVSDGALFRDQFFEIYNNSNEVIYADGLYYAQLLGNNSTTVRDYTLANGQFDWSKSPEQTKANPNTDFVYADHVYQIPGSGQEYPVNPGESIVVAGTAVNHKQPLTVGSETFSVNDPSLTIDLSKASFEVYYADYLNANGGSPYPSDYDNPDVPNVIIAHHVNERELILDPSGRDSYVIFKTGEFSSFEKIVSPKTTTPTADSKRYLQIPNEVIIDGVAINREDPTRVVPARMDVSIDGGYMVVPSGSYSSTSIIRKVAQEFGERKVLQDTNNSTNDFETANLPVPGAWK